MLKIAAYTLTGLGIGFAIATWTGSGSPAPSLEPETTSSVDRRLAALERSLADERQQRASLAESLEGLQASLSELNGERALAQATASSDDSPLLSNTIAFAGPAEDARQQGRRRFEIGDRRLNEQSQLERYVEAGLTPERAQWIQQRTSELRMEALQARYDAQRDGVALSLRSGLSVDETLRAELGDSDYEQYLEAQGRSTRVGIGSVLASSPAEQAGLQSGDQVVSYAGQRVFAMDELTALTFEGQPGENVVVDVLRDGQQIQLYLPRGPIGITAGGRARAIRVRP